MSLGQTAEYRTAYVHPRLSATHAFPLKAISSAFADAVQVKNGRPTEQAIVAAEWLVDDAFHPGTFRWACHILDLDPVEVRTKGLPAPKGRWFRNGCVRGIDDVINHWIAARATRRAKAAGR